MAEESLLKRHQVLLICVILVLLIVAAFEPLRHNDFIDYDDQTYILLNHHILSGITYESLTWALTSGYAGNWHPLTWLSHMIDIELFGLNAAGHHIHNLVLHIASVVLLFLILRAMTGTLWRSAFVAIIFGIHPLRVESVAWTAERKDVLCTFFWMLTTAAYIGYARRGGVFRYLLVASCLCLGLMAKPMIVTLPIIFLLLDVWPLRRINHSLYNDVPESARCFRPASSLWLIGEKIPLLVLIAVSCVVTYKVQSWSGAVDALNITWVQRLANVFISYITYLQKTVWPVNLAPLYPFPENGWPLWKPAVALILLSGWSVFTIYAVRKRPYLLFGWLWYIIALVPVIGLVQIGNHSTADRYSYLPSIGILVMMAWAAEELSTKIPYRKTFFAVLSGVSVVALIMTTRTQAAYWKDSYTIGKHTLAVTENNYVFYNNMGIVLMNQDKDDEAFSSFRKTLEIRPDYYLANANIAALMNKLHRYDEALAYVVKAIKKQPFNGLAYFIQGRTFEGMGNSDAALLAYKRAAKMDSGDFRFYYDTGVLLAKKGDMEEAIRYFKECIRYNSTWGDAYRDMGLAQQHLGLIWDALESYRMALKLIPNNYIVCYRIGYCFQKVNHPRDAIYFYRQTLKIRPNLLQALDGLAWLLATYPDSDIRNPSEAVLLAEKAAQITAFNDYEVLNTLAAAYAGQSRFKEAVEVIQKAITLAQTNNDTDSVREFTSRLELYQKDQIYLEPAAVNPQTKESVAGK
jgi:protein O-mannosyl-transferase